MRLEKSLLRPGIRIRVVALIFGLGGIVIPGGAFAQRPQPKRAIVGGGGTQKTQPAVDPADEDSSGESIRPGDQVYVWLKGQVHTAQVDKVEDGLYDLTVRLDNTRFHWGKRARSDFSLRPPIGDEGQPLPLPKLVNSLDARTWTDTSGRFEQVAVFLRVDAEDVVLKKPDGSILRVPLDKLSTADRDYVRQITGKNTGVAKSGAADRTPARSQRPASKGRSPSRESELGSRPRGRDTAPDDRNLSPDRPPGWFDLPNSLPQIDDSGIRSIVFSSPVTWQPRVDSTAAAPPARFRSFVWTLPTEELKLQMPSVAASDDGALLAFAWSDLGDQTTRLQACFVDDLDACPTLDMSYHECAVADVSPAGHWILTNLDHGYVDLWFVARTKLSYQKRVGVDQVVRFLDDERLMYIGERTIKISDLRTLRGLYQFPVSGPTAYAVSANQRVIACHADKAIWLLDSTSGDVVGRLESQLQVREGSSGADAVQLSICPRGDVLIAQAKNHFELYDLNRGALVSRFEIPDVDQVNDLHWINDDLVLCSNTFLLDPARKSIVWRLTTDSPVNRLIPVRSSAWLVARYLRNACVLHSVPLPPPALAHTPSAELPGTTLLGRYGPE